MSVRTFCLECERKIDLGDHPQVGQRVKCEYCEVQLEIINLEPLELDWIYERGPNQPGYSLPDVFGRTLT
jgi:hypothetical protein